MPFVGLMGHDVQENMNFCMQQIIQDQAKGITGPFAGGMVGFMGILNGLMDSANSFRVMLATLLGGMMKIISEFRNRFIALSGRIKISVSRVKALMYRVYGTMFAIIFIALSTQTALFNFGDTFIFKFIDAFCFPGETPIRMFDGTEKPLKEIKIHDVLQGGQVVESLYSFFSDGQEMVRLGSVVVSSNHFVSHNGKWIMAEEHPDAKPIGPWRGGLDAPLYCLTTNTHRIPISKYLFADYDETEGGNAATQAWVDASLNGVRRVPTPHPDCSYEIGCSPETKIQTDEGLKPLSAFKLGDTITGSSKVVGIQISEISDVCFLPSGIAIGSGSLLWNENHEKWVRAYSLLPRDMIHPQKVIALFVSPGAHYTLEDGTIVRDAMEIYSPETKQAYAEALRKERTDA